MESYKGKKSTTCLKTDSPALKDIQLTNFCGEYYSDELETSYKIYKDGNILKLYNSNFGEFPLIFIGSNNAMVNSIIITFEIQDDKVTGLRVTGNRVINLKFDKIK